MWPRWGDPCPQTEPCLWNPDVPQMWTSSHFYGSSVDLLFHTKGSKMVSLSMYGTLPMLLCIFSVSHLKFDGIHKSGQQARYTRKRYINLYHWDDDFELQNCKSEYLSMNYICHLNVGSPSRVPSSLRPKVAICCKQPSKSTTAQHQTQLAATASCLHVGIKSKIIVTPHMKKRHYPQTHLYILKY